MGGMGGRSSASHVSPRLFTRIPSPVLTRHRTAACVFAWLANCVVNLVTYANRSSRLSARIPLRGSSRLRHPPTTMKSSIRIPLRDEDSLRVVNEAGRDSFSRNLGGIDGLSRDPAMTPESSAISPSLSPRERVFSKLTA